MSDPANSRKSRPATAAERQAFETYRQQIEQDLPELRQQAAQTENDLRAAAMREPTVSGQLRRAILESGIDCRDLADQAGLSAKTLAEFLVGRAVLDSVAVDKLAALLKQQLTPIAL
jgi:ribosome-binding protein aMBF1 (putative translation factor)